MLFRSRRNSNGGAVSPRQSGAFVTTVGNFASAGGTSSGFERPNSAPVADVLPLQPSSSAPAYANAKTDDGHTVEDRLSIVKRSRTTSSTKPYTTRESSSSSGPILSPPDLVARPVDPSAMTTAEKALLQPSNTGVTPPCSSYPTFSTAKLPKHEQHVMDALISEFTEVLFFS